MTRIADLSKRIPEITVIVVRPGGEDVRPVRINATQPDPMRHAQTNAKEFSQAENSDLDRQDHLAGMHDCTEERAMRALGGGNGLGPGGLGRDPGGAARADKPRSLYLSSRSKGIARPPDREPGMTQVEMSG